jgi:N-acetyl-anhydromuramyl-L-alanine amidase AmpD
MKCDYPRDEQGQLITAKLPPQQLNTYQGILGHYHVDTGKTDPGPAFQWDLVINGAKKLMK